MEDEGWLRAVFVSVFGAIGIGLGVAVVCMVIGLIFTGGACSGGGECVVPLFGMGVGALAGVLVAAGAVAALSARRRLDSIFGVGAALSFLLLTTAILPIWFYKHEVLVLLAGLLLVGSAAVSRHHVAPGRWRWRRPRPAGVLLAVGLVLLAAVPLTIKLVEVSQEQRKIEAIIPRPLQTDLFHSSPDSVKYAASGITYDVEGQQSYGHQGTLVYVTLRTLDTEPCHGFSDVVEEPVIGCTKVAPGIWQGRETDSRPHFFVRGPDRQWAHVVALNYDVDEGQPGPYTRALEIARSLKPRSAWSLAADVVECGFC